MCRRSHIGQRDPMTTGPALGVEVVGSRDLRRRLKAAGDDLADMKAAHDNAAGIVSRRAKLYAPKRSGKLANSVRPAGTKTRAAVRVGKKRVPYAGVIHYGWQKRNIAANPFMTDALEDTRKQWLPAYAAALDKITNRID